MLEVAIKFFFDNFVYSFGGETYLQGSGGPIGARLTMAMSRLVMQQWWDDFSKVMLNSNVKFRLKAIYVDDGRMIVQKLQKGTRYCSNLKRFIIKEDKVTEDNDLTREEVTEREFRAAMCNVSSDLQFTTETEKDFSNGRLPTLSFQLWSEKGGIRHTYYEKSMRSQVLTQKLSSQSEQSKYSILVNELTRRFEVMDKNISVEERTEVVDHYTQQLKNSGYSNDQIRVIIQSSRKGIIRKEENRKNREFAYRSG